MYSIDPGAKRRIAPLLDQVLIVDSNAHMAALLADFLCGSGCGEVIVESDPESAFKVAERVGPTLIVTEALADADPFSLVRSIRRSSMGCRQAPVIVLTTLGTASGMQLAKNAGAHELIRKPFSRRDLVKRLDHLATRPRAWVEKPAYVGPDRRSFNSGGAIRRLSDRLELIDRGIPATSLYMTR